jgi:hypothetical protein
MKRNPFLKVKLKTLAEEARIIRQEKSKAIKDRDYDLANHLHIHRIETVRRECRATLLAYQCLRGIPYTACERENSTRPDTDAFERMCKRYGGLNISFDRWKDGLPVTHK